MARAIWRDTVIAESDTVEIVEGNVYFPRAAVSDEHVRESDTSSRCVWKGVASYFHVVVGAEVNRDAGWYYASPSAAASHIKDHVAFWRGVTVEK